MRLTGEQWIQSAEKIEQDQEWAHEFIKLTEPYVRALGNRAVRLFGGEDKRFYTEYRYGIDEPVVKVCTMPATDTPIESLDPVIRWARDIALDEMPQLDLVVEGKMAFFARPRPLVESGNEATHQSISTMEKKLAPCVFDQWKNVLDVGPPGLVSSFSFYALNLSSQDSVERWCQERANHDIDDFKKASPEYDRDFYELATAFLKEKMQSKEAEILLKEDG